MYLHKKESAIQRVVGVAVINVCLFKFDDFPYAITVDVPPLFT